MLRTILVALLGFSLAACGEPNREAAIRLEKRLTVGDMTALDELAQAGQDPWHALALGRAYQLGIGRLDLAEAMYAYSRAQSLPVAWYNAGLVYWLYQLPGPALDPGHSEPKNGCFSASNKGSAEKAIDCLGQAAMDARLPHARTLLGDIYRLGGAGVRPNIAQACYWYAKAAEEHHPEGRYRLGMCYLSGEGMPLDRERAVRLLSEAGKSGHREALRGLAEHFESLGVRENAAFWWNALAELDESVKPRARQSLTGLDVKAVGRIRDNVNIWSNSHRSDGFRPGYLPMGVADS